MKIIPRDDQRSRAARIDRLRRRLSGSAYTISGATFCGILREVLDLLDEHDEHHRTRVPTREPK